MTLTVSLPLAEQILPVMGLFDSSSKLSLRQSYNFWRNKLDAGSQKLFVDTYRFLRKEMAIGFREDLRYVYLSDSNILPLRSVRQMYYRFSSRTYPANNLVYDCYGNVLYTFWKDSWEFEQILVHGRLKDVVNREEWHIFPDDASPKCLVFVPVLGPAELLYSLYRYFLPVHFIIVYYKLLYFLTRHYQATGQIGVHITPLTVYVIAFEDNVIVEGPPCYQIGNVECFGYWSYLNDSFSNERCQNIVHSIFGPPVYDCLYDIERCSPQGVSVWCAGI